MNCKVCGKLITARKNKNYCSRECYNKRPKSINEIIDYGEKCYIKIVSKKYGEKHCFIDSENIQKIKKYNWTLAFDKTINNFYIKTYDNGTIKLHRYIVNCPKGLEVDHINHNTLDNRVCNLKICSHFENQQNKRCNKSGKVGVCYYSKTKKWAAEIAYNNKRYKLGYYNSFEEAKNERINAEKNIYRIEEYVRIKRTKKK